MKSRAGASGMAPPAAAGFERHTRTSPRMALVERCRSWDSSVYLTFEDSTRGWAAVSPAGLAIAAACQAAGRPVAALAWGHDGDWNAGQGRFEGVLLAVELEDLSPAEQA